jgi:hypothetical protein
MKTVNQFDLIKKLAEEFSIELTNLPVTVLPNGDIVHHSYLIKHEKNGNWGLYSIQSTDFKHHFYLKSCALLAAYFYEKCVFTVYHKIQTLDREYWRNYSNSVIYKHHLKNLNDNDQKIILLNRLECAEIDANYFKKEISKLFKRSFV